MRTELIWLLLPVCGLLSQAGGTWWKGYRRFGIPISMALAWCLFMGFDWRVILMALVQWGAYSMPITLKGDSIPNNGWVNWAWLPVLGILQCSSPLFMDHKLWFGSVICGSILGLMYALSNVKATAHLFQWKFVEFWSGVLPAVVLCFAIT